MSLILLLLLNLFASCFGAPTYFGVNLSGGEWDTSGAYFPSNNTVNYFLGKGFNIIRLPFYGFFFKRNLKNFASELICFKSLGRSSTHFRTTFCSNIFRLYKYSCLPNHECWSVRHFGSSQLCSLSL